ncbi:MAG: insulinase family protein [Proteobacteria bacterium]|nr:insulinase family protein [Pseudomonadota bacterium]
MKFELNKICCGFRLIKKEKIEEINASGMIFEHEKSGAHLIVLKNEDDNKVFSISFKTIPKDDTGVAHILEHSTLCGSRKFPSKEPFLELMKGSLNTFLNAMTSPDKTTYPIASRNEKDFFNLMDVYLDAVFNPNIYKYPEIFMQEGWHYELENRDVPISYKGVVYNEMKGALSSPERILGTLNQSSLFPDNTYRFNAGGDPEYIPELTYETFLNFHRKYYHPSNSYILLYGDGDIEKELRFIDENYLSHFDKIEVDAMIEEQKLFETPVEISDFYPIAEKEDSANKTYLSMNFAVGKSSDSLLNTGSDILKYILLDSSAAPLKKALIDANIGKDVFGEYEDDILQPYFSIIVKNSSEEKKELFKNTVYETLKNLCKNGIDQDLKKAAINKIEFQLREADYRGLPKGLIYDFAMLKSWMRGKEPFEQLRYEKHLSYIKKNIDSYFEELIEKYFLDNKHASVIVLNPKRGMAEEKERKTNEKLKKIKESLTEQEINKLIEETKKLKKRQKEPDSEEVINKIPHLAISDINKKAEIIPSFRKEIGNTAVLHQPIRTNGIVYLNLLFDASPVKADKIQYMSLLGELLGAVNTKQYTYAELSNLIDINMGGLSFSLDSYGDFRNPSIYHKKFVVKSKTLETNFTKTIDIIDEVINNTIFNNKKRIREIVQRIKSRMEMYIMTSGHTVSSNRLHSNLSQRGMFDELTGGIEFYKFISNLDKNFDDKFESIVKNLEEVKNTVFNKRNLLIGIATPDSNFESIKSDITKLTETLNNAELKASDYSFTLAPKNEALLTPMNVQFVSMGNNYIDNGFKWSGKFYVLNTIISRDYMWNNVRVMGGAYGAFASFNKYGEFTLSSYRDPNLVETINVYKNLANYIEKTNFKEKEITKFIIGTIGKMDFPLTPSMKGKIAIGRYISGISNENLQKDRDDVLSTTSVDIKNFSGMLKQLISSGKYCVIGNEGKIKSNSTLFDKMTSVFE